MLSHTIQQPNIPDVGESSRRGAVPSWTHRELLENFGRVSSLHCCALLLSHSSLYLQDLLTKNAITWLPQLKTLYSRSDLLQTRHSAFPCHHNNVFQPGQSTVPTTPGTMAAHRDEVPRLLCKVSSVWSLTVFGMQELIKPKTLQKYNGEKCVGEEKARERFSLPDFMTNI